MGKVQRNCQTKSYPIPAVWSRTTYSRITSVALPFMLSRRYYPDNNGLSRRQEGIVPHSSPSYGLLPVSRHRPSSTESGMSLFQTSSTLVQLPRKTGRTISSHPQAFPLALSVHMQNCHWCFRENLSKVFTRTALTVPLLFLHHGRWENTFLETPQTRFGADYVLQNVISNSNPSASAFPYTSQIW